MAMECKKCGGATNVVDSREAEFWTRRRRECLGCGERFTTHERSEDDEATLTGQLYGALRYIQELSREILEKATHPDAEPNFIPRQGNDCDPSRESEEPAASSICAEPSDPSGSGG